MKKFGEKICTNRKIIIIISIILLFLSLIGMKATKINYDILVYLPEDIETIKGQYILTDDFNMGAYSIALAENISSQDLLKLEKQIKEVEGVNTVASLYDVIGSSIPLEILPSEVVNKVHDENADLLIITFDDSTSSERTLNAVEEIRNIAQNKLQQGGMSSMVLDTMNLSNHEIIIYIIIAVILCLLILEASLDSYIVPFILLANIGSAIIFNLGSNIVLGEISYITKALVAVLQLGVTMDFSIFLYHSYENLKKTSPTKETAMIQAINETLTSITGSSLTTIAGFLVLCTMQLTLGSDLGIVMAKGVLLGVISTLILFPSLLLTFDKYIEKTKHKVFIPNFTKLNKFIIKYHKTVFIIFVIMLIPSYLAYSKVDVYYKIDKTLPDTLESIKTNEILKENYNIVSPEIILINKDLKNDKIEEMINSLEEIDGIDFVLSYSKLKSLGITENMLSDDITSIFENDKYQVILFNSLYDIASDELNDQITIVSTLVKSYDKGAIVAGEGPLMKDLIEISDTDFKNVNASSIICIFIILFIILKSLSLPFLLIIAIEFAIFTNMGISYFNGTTLPFVAPIVLGTIQLGATIDYAILLTTTYLNKRKNGLIKQDAMLEALNYSGNSIFVSGMCFFAATFGVGIYSDLEMVGTLCTLISRGAIISMLAVIIILSSILLIFDKLIIKTTKNIRKEKIMNKKSIKNAIIGILITITLYIPHSAFALTKNETVFSKLNYDGTPQNVLVNEELINTSKADTLEDYSELENILNISNDSTFEQNGYNITWNSLGNNIIYQGTTNQELPITVDITYKLDGKITELDDMLGKSGKVSIILNYHNTDKHTVLVNGKSEVLYTPFVVSTGTILDTETNYNITINNGKVVSTTNKNIVVGLATPGLYDSLKISELKNMETIEIIYDTTNFSLPSIYSVITPKLIESSDLKIFTKLDSLYESASELQENMDLIETSSNTLSNGSSELKKQLSSSINKLSQDTTDALTSEQLSEITNQTLNSITSKFTDSYKEELANNAWQSVSKELESSNLSLKEIITSSVNNAVIEYLKSVNKYDDYLNCEAGKIKQANGEEISEEIQNSCLIIENDPVLPYLKQAVSESGATIASNVSMYVAENVSKKVAVGVAESSAIETATSITNTLVPSLANQIKTSSISSISSSLNTLYSSIELLDNGLQSLSEGITKFNTEGITQMTSLVNTDLKDTTEKAKALVKLGENYQSLMNTSNKTTGETKFILVVDSKKKIEDTKDTDKTEEKITIWTRIKNLFN